jgi:hypothetical protein
VGKIYRIGILEPTPAARNAANLDALRKGLRRLGYVEGRNLVIEYRSVDGRADRRKPRRSGLAIADRDRGAAHHEARC